MNWVAGLYAIYGLGDVVLNIDIEGPIQMRYIDTIFLHADFSITSILEHHKLDFYYGIAITLNKHMILVKNCCSTVSNLIINSTPK
jgi:hypothetical protein